MQFLFIPQAEDIAVYVSALVIFAFAAHPLSRAVRSHPSYLHLTGNNGAHFRQLDGLRGILALSVVLHHLMRLRRFAQGNVWEAPMPRLLFAQLGPFAVTMFFFLTGFLFWTKLMRSERIEQGSYWKARVMRLGPVYLLAVLLLFLEVACISGFRLHTSRSDLFKSALGWMLFTIPATVARDLNGIAGTKWLIAGTPWSLRMEWCFYAAVPCLAWFARRPYRALVLPVLAYGSAHLLQGNFNAIVLLMHDFCGFFAACFSVGIAAAYFRQRFQQVDMLRGSAASVLGILLVLWVQCRFQPEYGFAESAGLAIPFLLVVSGNTFWGALTARPMVFLGQISYSVYLLHGLVLSASYLALDSVLHIGQLAPPLYWLYLMAVGLAVICVSTVSYRFLELPFISGRNKVAAPVRPEMVKAELVHA